MVDANQPETLADDRVGALVSIAKSINYLTKRKSQCEKQIVNINKQLKRIVAEKRELSAEFKNFDFYNYEEIQEEISCLTQSFEFQNATDPNHYMILRVEELRQKAPKM